MMCGKKVIKLRLSEPVERELLSSMGDLKEYDGMAVRIEVDRNDIKKCSHLILESLPVVDFNIEDIPIEDGIALLYSQGGEKVEVG
jgi:ABC-2 type transport system ATP-binding protein